MNIKMVSGALAVVLMTMVVTAGTVMALDRGPDLQLELDDVQESLEEANEELEASNRALGAAETKLESETGLNDYTLQQYAQLEDDYDALASEYASLSTRADDLTDLASELADGYRSMTECANERNEMNNLLLEIDGYGTNSQWDRIADLADRMIRTCTRAIEDFDDLDRRYPSLF